MWYLVLSRTLKHGDAKQPHYDAHREWLEAQHRAGRALFSGPSTDDTYGIYVLLAPSLAEARALAAQDPYHQLGDRKLEQVLEWSPRRAMRLQGPTIEELEAMARGDGGA
ncbi:MAG TPA: YciI family protein [Chloroflexota bacterium]|nr:YciI family protein [Chloroflexota bacterium]